MKGLSFTIDSELGNVSLVAVAVNGICMQLGLDEVSAGQVELCIAEAATNAIRHAYHDDPGHTVVIALAIGGDRLNIEVSDTGTSMPVEQEQKLRLGTRAFELQTADRSSLVEAGRGLQIIHDLMDEVSYIRAGNFNRLMMTKQLLSSAGNEDRY